MAFTSTRDSSNTTLYFKISFNFFFIYHNIPIFYQVREQFCSYDEDKDGRITDEEMEIGMTINKVNLVV